jgi:hypothetical protein
MEPAVIVGFISTLAGSALQEDIASIAQQLRRKGQDIVYKNATARPKARPKSDTPSSNRAV